MWSRWERKFNELIELSSIVGNGEPSISHYLTSRTSGSSIAAEACTVNRVIKQNETPTLTNIRN